MSHCKIVSTMKYCFSYLSDHGLTVALQKMQALLAKPVSFVEKAKKRNGKQALKRIDPWLPIAHVYAFILPALFVGMLPFVAEEE